MRRLTSVGPALPLVVLSLAVIACDAPPASPPLASVDADGSRSSALAGDLAMTQGFRKQVTVAGIREHQAAFQQIADANGGVRALGTPGYAASAQYVVDRMAAAGYQVSTQDFTFEFAGDRTPPVLTQLVPNAVTYVNGTDFSTMAYSGSGDVTAPLTAVDFEVPIAAPDISTSGCEAADFAGFPAGNIALLQRGTCLFRVKVTNALAAGATGVIIVNDGQPTRLANFGGTLSPPQVGGPVVSGSFALGEVLRNGVLNGPTGVTVRLRTDFVVETRTGRNVIAETRGGDPSRVIVVGSRLDSDTRGPGINWASGAATALEIAEIAAPERPINRIRFVWFGEQGTFGSNHYVDNLTVAERTSIAAMLDLAVVGSPNFGRFVYDGDASQFPILPAAPAGSATLEQLLTDYFGGVSLPSAPVTLAGVSSHLAFLGAGIPVAGISSGSTAIKTAAEAALFGGTPGVAFDPCTALPCDTFANVSLTGLEQLSDAAAHVVLVLSRRNLAKSPLVTP